LLYCHCTFILWCNVLLIQRQCNSPLIKRNIFTFTSTERLRLIIFDGCVGQLCKNHCFTDVLSFYRTIWQRQITNSSVNIYYKLNGIVRYRFLHSWPTQPSNMISLKTERNKIITFYHNTPYDWIMYFFKGQHLYVLFRIMALTVDTSKCNWLFFQWYSRIVYCGKM
jgi:hypothetical protein